MAQAAQPRHVGVFDLRGAQGSGQHFFIELRIVPGPGHGANITSRFTSCACSNSIKPSSDRVEWPIISTSLDGLVASLGHFIHLDVF